MRDFILTSLIAILACLFCIWLLRPLAVRVGFVDRPSDRKLHEDEIPMIGGIAIFFGFCFSLLHLHFSLMPYRSLLAGSAILVLMGVVDDFRDLSARLRLFGQLMVALILTSWGGLLVIHLGNIFFIGNVSLGLWALPFTVLLVVAYINAVNMIDGQDGLAGYVALAQIFWLFIYAYQLKLSAMPHILLILFMLLLVFLNFNMRLPWRRKPSIFLGDSGSTFIAFLLAWVAIKISQTNIAMVNPIALLWIMALPLFDLINVVIYRLRQKKSIFTPGRDHFHHVLHFAGVNKTLSTLLLGLLQLALGGIGYLLNYSHISEGVNFIIFASTLTGYLVLVVITRSPKQLKNSSTADEIEQYAE